MQVRVVRLFIPPPVPTSSCVAASRDRGTGAGRDTDSLTLVSKCRTSKRDIFGRNCLTITACTACAAPSTTRQLRNHVKKIIGKPRAGKPHARMKGGVGKRICNADTAPLTTNDATSADPSVCRWPAVPPVWFTHFCSPAPGFRLLSWKSTVTSCAISAATPCIRARCGSWTSLGT